MTSRSEYRQVFSGLLTGRPGAAKRLDLAQQDTDWQDSGLLVTATFALLADERFADDNSIEAATIFVAEACQNYAKAATPMDSTAALRVTRAVLGEPALLNDVTRQDQLNTQILLVYKLVRDLDLSAERISQVLDRAEALVDGWTSGG